MPDIENLQSDKETDRFTKGREKGVCFSQREKSSDADVGLRAANSQGTVPRLSGEEEELGGLQRKASSACEGLSGIQEQWCSSGRQHLRGIKGTNKG